LLKQLHAEAGVENLLLRRKAYGTAVGRGAIGHPGDRAARRSRELRGVLADDQARRGSGRGSTRTPPANLEELAKYALIERYRLSRWAHWPNSLPPTMFGEPVESPTCGLGELR